jgi:predicted enzyme related to lactoylglutathione lyase
MAEFTSYPSGTPSWVDLQSPDVPATVAFYAAVFGWGSEDLGPEAGGYTPLTKGGRWVAGVGPQMMEGAPVQWLTYVAVDDVAATTEVARAAGASVLMEPMDVLDAGKLAVFADPVGGVIALWEAGSHTGAQLANEPNTFVWSELHTRDTAASMAFYGTVFGWTGKTEDFGGMPYTQWMLGDHEVGGMMPMPEMAPAEVGAYWNTYFAVESTDAAIDRVRENGGGVVVPASDTPVGRLAVVQDPMGAMFSLIEMPAQS